jgi:hypothetical protein
MTVPAPIVSPELRALLRRVKLGRTLDTLPERLALARSRSLGHAEFLEVVLSDEVTRRDTHSADLRARTAGLDPAMRLEHWDNTAAVTYDHATLDELVSLRFIEAAHNVIVLGPVGVGKTFLATALGHAAIRRRASVHFERGDHLLKRLKASRLDNSHDATATPPPSSRPTATPSNGSPSWPTPSWPNPPSTASNPPPTNSSSTAKATGADKNPSPAATPPQPTDQPVGGALDHDATQPPSSAVSTLTAPGPGPMPLAERRSHPGGGRH